MDMGKILNTSGLTRDVPCNSCFLSISGKVRNSRPSARRHVYLWVREDDVLRKMRPGRIPQSVPESSKGDFFKSSQFLDLISG